MSLSFDQEDVATELASWVTAENGLDYAEVHEADQTSAAVLSPTVKVYPDATDGHTSVLHIPHNRSGSIGFNGAFLSDVNYYVISFDWRITITGGSTTRLGAFGQTNVRNEGAAVDERYVHVFRVDRSNGKVDFGKPYYALLSMDVISYEPENCPICKEGKVPVTKPGTKALGK